MTDLETNFIGIDKLNNSQHPSRSVCMNNLIHGTKNPLSFGKNLNTAVENK
jgi:hypothetical protein